jgi:sedoheptulokinase
MLTLGLDIGTTSISCAVMADDRQLSAVTVANDTYRRDQNRPWAREQDPAEIWSKCRQILTDQLQSWPDIKAIGITGQMHGIVYLDHSGEAISPLITWEDERGNLTFSDGLTYAEHLSAITGHQMATGYGLTTHYYHLKNNLVPERAAKISTIMDYVAMKLCGKKEPATHPSNAAALGLFDLQNSGFNLEALTAAGIDPAILPQVLTREEYIGTISNQAIDSAQTIDTAAYEIMVTVPIGDVQAGIFGLVREDTDVVLNIGTSSQVSCVSDNCVFMDKLDCKPFVRGKYILLGAGLCGGSSLQLLNDFYRQVCTAFSHEVSKDLVFEKMLALAEQAYDVESAEKASSEYGLENDRKPNNALNDANQKTVQVQTLFRGRRDNPQLRGSINGIGIDNLNPGALTLGFMRGVCLEMHDYYKMMPADRQSSRLLLAGNALRRNPLLRQLSAEIFDSEVCLTHYQEEAAAGAALLAASAADNS